MELTPLFADDDGTGGVQGEWVHRTRAFVVVPEDCSILYTQRQHALGHMERFVE